MALLITDGLEGILLLSIGRHRVQQLLDVDELLLGPGGRRLLDHLLVLGRLVEELLERRLLHRSPQGTLYVWEIWD